jgi:hypothetical protein
MLCSLVALLQPIYVVQRNRNALEQIDASCVDVLAVIVGDERLKRYWHNNRQERET